MNNRLESILDCVSIINFKTHQHSNAVNCHSPLQHAVELESVHVSYLWHDKRFEGDVFVVKLTSWIIMQLYRSLAFSLNWRTVSTQSSGRTWNWQTSALAGLSWNTQRGSNGDQKKKYFFKKSYQNYKLKKSYQITRCKFRLVDRSSK